MLSRILTICFAISLIFICAEIFMGFSDYLKVPLKTVFIQTGKKMYPGSGVENFGKVDENMYRGSRPRKQDYIYLKNKLGVKTILDLTDDPEDWCQEHAEKLGLRYINIPLSDKNYPTESQVTALEKTVMDKNLYPMFLHCEGGRHRSGSVVGIYRIKAYGWDINRVYKEMKEYDWYTAFGHKPLKDFIFDYAEKNK